MYYYMPPKAMVVEVMTDGFTDDNIFPILVARPKETGAFPYVPRKESTALIFNRLWAEVKREVLTILSEGASVPEEIDDIWQEIFLKGKIHPCRIMDEIGLDTVQILQLPGPSTTESGSRIILLGLHVFTLGPRVVHELGQGPLKMAKLLSRCFYGDPHSPGGRGISHLAGSIVSTT